MERQFMKNWRLKKVKFRKFDKLTFQDWQGKFHRGFFLSYKAYKNKGMKKYGTRCLIIVDSKISALGFHVWTVPAIRLTKGWKK